MSPSNKQKSGTKSAYVDKSTVHRLGR